jgi:phage-related protein
MQAVITWYKNLGKSILTWIGDLAQTLWKKGRNLIAGFWGGIWERMQAVITWLKDVSWKILTWIGDLGETLLQKGKDLIQGFWDGIQALWDGVLGVATWLKNLGAKAVSAVGNLLETLVQAGKDLIQGFWDGIQEIWDDVWEWIKDKIDLVPGFLKSALGLDSPSKITREMGRQFMEGFAVGFEEDKTFDRAQANLANNINGFKRSLSSAVENLGTTEEFNPVITPVLDLTSVQADAKKMNGYIQSTQKITPVLSFKQAQLIAAGTRSQPEETAESVTARGEVKFEQNIFAPKQLSTNDIYKQTRNQITMAKEELSIR